MKLSEMNTLKLSSALCRMAEPIERIGKDEQIAAYFRRVSEAKDDSQTRLEQLTGMAGALIPALLDTHRVDTMIILSALTGKSVEEIERQNGLVTIKEAMASIDRDLLDFFK